MSVTPPRAILLTGSTGIAAETALQAARTGYRVFLASRSGERLRELADRIGADGGDARWLAVDWTVEAEAERAAAGAMEVFGRIDALFNVAGISARRHGDGPVHECRVEAWDLSFNANVKTAFLASKAVLRRMLDQEPDGRGQRGAILNMASVLWHDPEPEHFATHAYAASKAAVVGLTRSMAAHYAPMGIRVNAISPGLVATPMTTRSQNNPAILDLMKRKQPVTGGIMDPASVARAALFLLGEDASAVTGEILTVDGGWNLL